MTAERRNFMGAKLALFLGARVLVLLRDDRMRQAYQSQFHYIQLKSKHMSTNKYKRIRVIELDKRPTTAQWSIQKTVRSQT